MPLQSHFQAKFKENMHCRSPFIISSGAFLLGPSKSTDLEIRHASISWPCVCISDFSSIVQICIIKQMVRKRFHQNAFEVHFPCLTTSKRPLDIEYYYTLLDNIDEMGCFSWPTMDRSPTLLLFFLMSFWDHSSTVHKTNLLRFLAAALQEKIVNRKLIYFMWVWYSS